MANFHVVFMNSMKSKTWIWVKIVFCKKSLMGGAEAGGGRVFEIPWEMNF